MVNLSINYIPGIKSGTRLDSSGLSPRLLSVIGNQNFSVGVRPEGVGTYSPGLPYSATLGYGLVENVGATQMFKATLKGLRSAVVTSQLATFSA